MIGYFKSALSEVWQDKRTLWVRLYLPLLLFAGLLLLVSLSLNEVGGSTNLGGEDGEDGQASESPKSTVGIVTNDNGDSLVIQMKVIESVDYQMINDIETVQEMMTNGDLDLAVVIDEFFDDAIQTGNSGEVLLYHNGYDDALKDGIKNNIDWYERRILNQRLASSGFDESYIDPVNISEVDSDTFTSLNEDNASSDSEDNATVFNEIGGVFILLFFYFAWLGGIYPALTLFTTDRLSSIVTDEPQKVLLGRTLAVAFFGLLHALLFLGLIFLIFRPYQPSGNLYAAMIKTALRADSLPFIILSLVPIAALFATFKSWSVTKQGTFKEAQNRLQPLKISVGLFILIGITAGFGTSLAVYLIPVVNIGTLSRLLLQNNLNWLYLVIAFVSCFSFAYWCNQFALKEFLKRVKTPVDDSLFTNQVTSTNLENDEEIE
ncbi:MAG: ABC transporter permease [Saprospiraceae bacterium]